MKTKWKENKQKKEKMATPETERKERIKLEKHGQRLT